MGALQRVTQNPVLWMLTFCMAGLVVLLIFGTFFLAEHVLLGLSIGSAVFVLCGFLVFIRREIAGPIIFYFVLGLSSFNLDGALFYFYTDSPEEYPEGPHFTAYFYTTAIGLVAFVGIMFGFLSGAELFKGWSYRRILGLTVVIR